MSNELESDAAVNGQATVGFLGFGNFAKRLAKRWHSGVGGRVCFHDLKPVPDEELEVWRWWDQKKGVKEVLAVDPPILAIGLPDLVTGTIAELQALAAGFETSKKAKKPVPKCVVAWDALPLGEIFGDSVDLLYLAFDHGIWQEDNPRALYPLAWYLVPHGSESPAAPHPETIAFMRAIGAFNAELQSQTPGLVRPAVELETITEFIFSKIAVSTLPFLGRLCRDCDIDLLEALILFRNRILGADNPLFNEAVLKKLAGYPSDPRSLRSIVDNYAVRGGNIKVMWRALLEEHGTLDRDSGISLRDDPLGKVVSAMERAWREHGRNHLAFAIEALSRSIARKAGKSATSTRGDFGRRVLEQLEDGLNRLLQEWKTHLYWAEIVRFGERPELHGASSGKAGDPHPAGLFVRNPKEFLNACHPLSELARDSGQMDEAWLVYLKQPPAEGSQPDRAGRQSSFSGRHHLEISGANVLAMDRPAKELEARPATVVDQDWLKWLGELQPGSKADELRKQLAWLLQKPAQEETPDRAAKVWRYLVWLFGAHPAITREPPADCAIFVPAFRDKEVSLALSLGGSLDLGAPVSTALSNLARTAFGLILEWENVRSRNLFAHAALMARNFSHNIGSHVLANAGLLDAAEIAPDAHQTREHLTTFHSFLQGRLDFIARALGESDSMVQPMFFESGVVQGFENQKLLRENLLKDQGLKICTSQVVVFSHDGTVIKEPGKTDVLVGIPGGMIGCHAFHALLENILRNAAKYGANKDNKDNDASIKATLTLRHGQAINGDNQIVDCHWLDITEDIGSTPEALEKIRGYLNDPVITSDGTPQVHGHGIQEMKACAVFLAHGLEFPADNTVEFWKLFPEEDHYRRYVERYGENTRLGSGALLAWLEGSQLTYRCILPKPVIYGIVGALPKPEVAVEGVEWLNDVEALADSPAHFGLILRTEDPKEQDDTLLEALAKHHHALPFRLLVVTKDKARRKKWIEAIEGCKQLPERRVHAVSVPHFFSETGSLHGFDNNHGAKLYVELCDAWLKAWKGDQPIQVRIGFARDAKHKAKQRWERSSEGFNSSMVSGEVVFGAINENRTRIEFGRFVEPSPRKITFDNHGTCFGQDPDHVDLNWVDIHHAFKGSAQRQLCDALEHPPGSGFPFAHYLFSLVEACLLRVVVVDERLAGAMLDSDQEINIDSLKWLQLAGIFPLFAITVGDGTPSRLCDAPQCAGDGLRISDETALIAPVRKEHKWVCFDMLKQNTDVLIVHEGLLDQIRVDDVGRRTWAEFLGTIRGVPRLLRTSGRGSRSRHRLEHIPFIEMALLSANTYQQMNKVLLGIGLLSARGAMPNR